MDGLVAGVEPPESFAHREQVAHEDAIELGALRGDVERAVLLVDGDLRRAEIVTVRQWSWASQGRNAPVRCQSCYDYAYWR